MTCKTCDANVKSPRVTGIYCESCFIKDSAVDGAQRRSVELRAESIGLVTFLLLAASVFGVRTYLVESHTTTQVVLNE